MPDHRIVIDEVLGELTKLKGHSSLQLTSIAKAIEQKNKRINKIIFHELTGAGLDKNGPAIMFSQELEMLAMGETNINVYEHFIFYETKDLNHKDVRFAIAHELGHIYLCNPMDKPETQRYSAPIEGAEKLFAVKYDPDDEIRADLFAFLMCEQRKVIPREQDFREPCKIRLLSFIENKILGTDSQNHFKDIKTCLDCNIH